MTRILLIPCLLLWGIGTIAQSLEGKFLLPAYIKDGDTILYMNLRTIEVVAKLTPEQLEQVKKYSRLRYNVLKVLPYARLAASMLKEMNAHMDSLKNEREKKRFLKQKEQELKDRFSAELKKLTYSQGRILIKLIDRETSHTSFELVRELRGGLEAYFWQGLARLFGENLKAEYDPEGEDRLIEAIIQEVDAEAKQ